MPESVQEIVQPCTQKQFFLECMDSRVGPVTQTQTQTQTPIWELPIKEEENPAPEELGTGCNRYATLEPLDKVVELHS